MSKCEKTSNNKYFNCPALMSDGRIFTDYRSSTKVNEDLMKITDINNSYKYRQFLIDNGQNIIDLNNDYINDKGDCNECNFNEVPIETFCVYNKVNGKCEINNVNGIGQSNIYGSQKLEDYSPKLQSVTTYNIKKESCNTLKKNALISFAAMPGEMC